MSFINIIRKSIVFCSVSYIIETEWRRRNVLVHLTISKSTFSLSVWILIPAISVNREISDNSPRRRIRTREKFNVVIKKIYWNKNPYKLLFFTLQVRNWSKQLYFCRSPNENGAFLKSVIQTLLSGWPPWPN